MYQSGDIVEVNKIKILSGEEDPTTGIGASSRMEDHARLSSPYYVKIHEAKTTKYNHTSVRYYTAEFVTIDDQGKVYASHEFWNYPDGWILKKVDPCALNATLTNTPSDLWEIKHI